MEFLTNLLYELIVVIYWTLVTIGIVIAVLVVCYAAARIIAVAWHRTKREFAIMNRNEKEHRHGKEDK